ncbi:hypothetical protein AURDEDRAFT_177643 [Auricularia subglabra TFB-10046 SS5]|uniref:Uncharacterized protein n=1 Tax=Auricularia subglabra (strain TFB-10046 / SS5) TaxID=717982 RepID=J0LA56_AURST|nr:hypothetical protein AURDEDRAFT_177643 [Auricularia subglabra TFB-10046 SS5]
MATNDGERREDRYQVLTYEHVVDNLQTPRFNSGRRGPHTWLTPARAAGQRPFMCPFAFSTMWTRQPPTPFQLYDRPLLQLGGRSREITALGNAKCKRDKSLQACEKIVLHEPTGLIYLATLWLLTAGNLNKTGARHGYIAVYNPATESGTRLPLVRFNPSDDLKDGTGLSVLGLDVVISAANEHEIFVYVVNHRPPLGDAWVWGPDTAVEIFKGEAGGRSLSMSLLCATRSLALRDYGQLRASRLPTHALRLC